MQTHCSEKVFSLLVALAWCPHNLKSWEKQGPNYKWNILCVNDKKNNNKCDISLSVAVPDPFCLCVYVI